MNSEEFSRRSRRDSIRDELYDSDGSSTGLRVRSISIDSSDEDEFTNDVEITEGGWICRVKRFEKYVDSYGRTHLYRGHVKDPTPHIDQTVQTPSEQQYSKSDGGKKSILYYYRHTPKARRGIVEPDEHITINSPLILEVLRSKATFGREVRTYSALDAFKAEGII